MILAKGTTSSCNPVCRFKLPNIIPLLYCEAFWALLMCQNKSRVSTHKTLTDSNNGPSPLLYSEAFWALLMCQNKSRWSMHKTLTDSNNGPSPPQLMHQKEKDVSFVVHTCRFQQEKQRPQCLVTGLSRSAQAVRINLTQKKCKTKR